MIVCDLAKLVKVFISEMVKKICNLKQVGQMPKSKKNLIIIRLLICITICSLYSLLILPRTLHFYSLIIVSSTHTPHTHFQY